MLVPQTLLSCDFFLSKQTCYKAKIIIIRSQKKKKKKAFKLLSVKSQIVTKLTNQTQQQQYMNPLIRPTTINRTAGVHGLEHKTKPWLLASPPSLGVSSISIVSQLFYAFMPMKQERLQKATTFIIHILFKSAL